MQNNNNQNFNSDGNVSRASTPEQPQRTSSTPIGSTDRWNSNQIAITRQEHFTKRSLNRDQQISIHKKIRILVLFNRAFRYEIQTT